MMCPWASSLRTVRVLTSGPLAVGPGVQGLGDLAHKGLAHQVALHLIARERQEQHVPDDRGLGGDKGERGAAHGRTRPRG